MTEDHRPAALKAAVQGYYDALDRDDIEAVLDSFNGDVLYRRPGYPTIVGMDGLRAYYSSDRKLKAGRHVIKALIAEGPTVAAHGVWEGELKGGGTTSMGFAAFFGFDAAGRIDEHTTYFFTPAV
jgi:uncharacterized protein